MRIEEIIYQTTRDLLNVEDKLRIATVFLFCERFGNEKMAELLYCNHPERFVSSLNAEYASYEVDFAIDFADKNISQSFEATRRAVIQKYDSDGFYKAVYNKDDFALAICDVCKAVSTFEVKAIKNEVAEQLQLFEKSKWETCYKNIDNL